MLVLLAGEHETSPRPPYYKSMQVLFGIKAICITIASPGNYRKPHLLLLSATIVKHWPLLGWGIPANPRKPLLYGQSSQLSAIVLFLDYGPRHSPS